VGLMVSASSADLSRLDNAASRVAASAQSVGEMCAALAVAARVSPSDSSDLLAPLEGVRDALRAAAADLVAVGASLPAREGVPTRDALTELVRVEATRSEALALTDALSRALPYAEALDTARGRSCWADDLGDMIGKLRLELYGPGGARE